MKCFLCDKNSIKLVYQLKDKQIVACQNDGLFFSVSNTDKKNLYSQKYYTENPYPTTFYQSYFQKKLDLIKSITATADISMLDVGCGWGQFLEIVRDNHLPYLGIDTATESINICQKKGLNCQKITVEALVKTKSNYFSVITSFQTLEHLPNPRNFLTSVYKLLKKDGVFLLTTPNNDSPIRKLLGKNWSVYNTDSHFVFYNQKTLTQCLNQIGFKPIKTHLDNWRLMSAGYIFSRLHLSFFSRFTLPVPTDPWGDLVAWAIK